MHAEPPHHDISRDPILDGRDSLRLVKLRLALTLITVAILPIAAVSPLIRAVSDEARVAHHQRLEAFASAAGTDLEQQLDRVGTATAKAAGDDVVLAAAGAGATSAIKTMAGNRMGDLLGRASSAIVGAALLEDGAVVASWGSVIVLPDAPVSPGLAITPGSSDNGPSLVSVSRADHGPTKGAARPVLVATLSMPALLRVVAPDPAMPGESVALLNAQGDGLASYRTGFDAAALPGQVLDIATESAHDSDGVSPLDVPGLAGWQVAISAPIPLAAIPLPAIGSLGGLIVLLIGFTLWMARQILRPAAQLEASRSRMRELYESAREAALRDSLTGLGNHRAFQEAVARMVEASRRYGTPFALVLLDIDEFKRINDTRGHAVGDQLLAQVGDLIRVTIRTTDAGFRVGGDEFAILLSHTDAGGALGLARRLLARGLEDRGGGSYPGPISFSAGVTACPAFALTRLELTAQADAALYRGKRAGRTVVTIYDGDLDRGHVDDGMRAELSSAITGVIESGSLTPVYQPIVDLAGGRVIGYEGLVRIPKEAAFAHTGALFDAAEAAGRVQDLDRAALEVVLRGASSLPPEMLLSLNVSPRSLESGELNATALLAILRRHAIAPERVIVELTERETVREPERLREVLRGIQRAGARVAADDVGAGNAGLRLLSQFQFDVVKIDLSLVQGGSREDQTMSVLTSIVQMAGRLGALTIAEGVETPEQLRTIRDLGITAGQGYLLGRPAESHAVTQVDLSALERGEDEQDPQSPYRHRRGIEDSADSGDRNARPWPDAPSGRSVAPSAEPVAAGIGGRDRVAAVRRRSAELLRSARGSGPEPD